MPAEALSALTLLWNYYLKHVVLIALYMWYIHVFFERLKYIWLASLLMIFAVFAVEASQLLYPGWGDPAADDIVVGVGTVVVLTLVFSSIKASRKRRKE